MILMQTAKHHVASAKFAKMAHTLEYILLIIGKISFFAKFEKMAHTLEYILRQNFVFLAQCDDTHSSSVVFVFLCLYVCAVKSTDLPTLIHMELLLQTSSTAKPRADSIITIVRFGIVTQ